MQAEAPIVAVAKPKPPPADFSRYMTTLICYKGEKECIGPTVKDVEKANVRLQWETFSKGNVRGTTAQDLASVVDQGVPFKSEIRITKPDGADKYHVYIMLRSGPGTKRQGKVKTFEIEDLSKLTEMTISDDPIKFKGGTIKTELVIGPPLPLDIEM